MQKIDLTGIKNIVFDLGGVIITLDRSEAVRRFMEVGLDNAEDLLDAYHQKGVFLELEEGKLSREEFYEALRQEAGKYISDDAIDYGWLGFIKELPESKITLLKTLKEKGYRLYLLSNTNPIIMSWAFSPSFSPEGKSIDHYFDKMYLSYQIGFTKPSSKIYDYMLKDSGLIPVETLFIDDGIANIEAGNKLGMKTYLAKNGEDFSPVFGF
jgi:putative hydrolase of the HAD superfamily